MKLSQWCKKQGITYHTGFIWFHKGLIPNARQLPTGTILIDEQLVENRNENVVIYCRVSNQSRKHELQYQIDRCVNFTNAKGLTINKVYKEIASGMNDNRTQLWKMLQTKPTIIIVENKDRLTRFGFNYLEKLLAEQGCTVIVMHRDHEDEQDIIKDLVSVITSFCCRIYGIRRGKNKAVKIKKVLSND
jgi:putative resolvase